MRKLTTMFALGLAIAERRLRRRHDEHAAAAGHGGVGCSRRRRRRARRSSTAWAAPPSTPRLTDPFNTDKTAHDAKLDAYNKAPQSMWPSFAPQFAASLGILDGLDGICGNQPLPAAGGADGGSAGEYGTLAGSSPTISCCSTPRSRRCDPTKNYLAVEIGVITGGAAASCGGRTPLDPAINVTYAAAIGGHPVDGTGHRRCLGRCGRGNAANLTTFPFLGAPN